MAALTAGHAGRRAHWERLWPIVWVGAFLASLAVAAAWGGPFPYGGQDPGLKTRLVLGMNIVVERLFAGGWGAFFYLAGAIGLGRLIWPFVRLSREFFALQCGAGLAAMLTYSHALGHLGLFASKLGVFFAYAPLVVGVLMLIEQVMVRQWARRGDLSVRLAPIIVVIPLAILLTAACTAPGVLWSSEFGGYDALSYHLQLPQEWLRLGRILPFEHNVYSFLPSYVESAFVHLGVLMGAKAGVASDPALLIRDGMPAIGCQLFHAFTTLLACWLLARATRAVLRRAGFDDRISTLCALVTGGVVFATPWVLVVGSLAYTEMVMVALYSSAVVAALEEDVTPVVRGLLVGALVGVACGAKATALLFAGAPTALLLVGMARGEPWKRIVIAGAVGGLLAISPWMVRNYRASGNPVFPAATSIFGRAHWSEEQVERFHRAHVFEGGVRERLKLLVMEDPNDPAGPRHRGMLHKQWGGFFWLTLVATPVCVWGLRRRGTVEARRLSWILPIGAAAQVVLWLFTTHLQSRFLVPMVVPCAMILGGALAALAELPPGLRVRAALGVLAMLMQTLFSVAMYRVELGGRPAERLFLTPGNLAGLSGLGEDLDAPEREAAISGNPTYYVNFRVLPRDGLIYLLGDAAPFYYVNASAITSDRVEVWYATTWDEHPLAEDIARNQNTHASGMVLAEFGMLEQWRRSGFGDPRLNAPNLERWMREHTDIAKDWTRAERELRRPVQLLRLR